MNYFSIASLVSIVAATAVLSALFQHSSTQNLLELGERNNVHLTQAFVNSLWPRFRPLVLRPADAAQPPPAVMRTLHDAVVRQMDGTSVVKVKIYNLEGRTVFSTQASQIGEDVSASAAFRAARDGGVVSRIAFKDKFVAFHQEITSRDVLFSYLPIRDTAGGRVEGVFEIYTDVTELTAKQRTQRNVMVLSVIAVFAALYLSLFLIVKRAHLIIVDSARKLEHSANHDVLTGLPNRALLQRRIREVVRMKARDGKQAAVLFIDLDRFKNVNDTHGHDAGDALLVMAASRLAHILRAGDTVSRQGGDEFMVLLPNIGDAAEAGIVAEKLLACLVRPFKIGGLEATVGASIGIAIFPDDGTDEIALLKKSDSAMYRAKEAGRNTYRYYSGGIDRKAPAAGAKLGVSPGA